MFIQSPTFKSMGENFKTDIRVLYKTTPQVYYHLRGLCWDILHRNSEVLPFDSS